ncbi:hydrolase [Streptomyces sp. 900105755]
MPDSQPQPPSSSSNPQGSSGQPDPAALLLCGARLTDGRTVDVRLGCGRIEAVGTAGSLAAGPARTGGTRVDLSGYLLLPAPAEPHAHGDTALSAEHDGPVSYEPEDVQRRATEAALLQLGHGATAVRAHVRVGDVQGLGALAAVLQARRSLRGLAELTAVAMPRVLTGLAGADGLAILRDAAKMGASVMGGCPDLDPDPTGYAEAVLEVASEHGCPVDLHTDATDPARLARLAAMAGGMRPGVVLGPCAGLARLPAEVAARVADQLAADHGRRPPRAGTRCAAEEAEAECLASPGKRLDLLLGSGTRGRGSGGPCSGLPPDRVVSLTRWASPRTAVPCKFACAQAC